MLFHSVSVCIVYIACLALEHAMYNQCTDFLITVLRSCICLWYFCDLMQLAWLREGICPVKKFLAPKIPGICLWRPGLTWSNSRKMGKTTSSKIQMQLAAVARRTRIDAQRKNQCSPRTSSNRSSGRRPPQTISPDRLALFEGWRLPK